jgi:hypothetical protein
MIDRIHTIQHDPVRFRAIQHDLAIQNDPAQINTVQHDPNPLTTRSSSDSSLLLTLLAYLGLSTSDVPLTRLL